MLPQRNPQHMLLFKLKTSSDIFFKDAWSISVARRFFIKWSIYISLKDPVNIKVSVVHVKGMIWHFGYVLISLNVESWS